MLEQIRARFPVALHGVALSIGSIDGVRAEHLKRIAKLAERIEPFQISDHLCFSRFGRHQYHELLPLPRTAAMASLVIRNVDRVQTKLRRQLVLENISAYREYPNNEMSEPEFLNLIAARSGCKLLLDINNIYVNAANFRFNARRYLRAIDPQHVVQYHLAGYTDMGTHLFDTHAEKVHSPVVRLFREARHHIGEHPFSLERDDRIPNFRSLERETLRLQAMVPMKMPQRFDLPLKSPLDVRKRNSKGPRIHETAWQKQIYSHAPGKNEIGAGTLSAAAAQQVYQRAYTIRLTSALREKHSLLTNALSETKILALFRGYTTKHPSSDEDLSHYGSGLPEYLNQHYQSMPWLADIARLDRIRFDLFHATVAESPANPFAQKVRLSASAILWQSAWTVVKIQRGKPKLLAKPVHEPQHLLYYRRQYAVESKILTTGQYLFVAKLTKPQLLKTLLVDAEKKNWLSVHEVRDLFRVLGLPGMLT